MLGRQCAEHWLCDIGVAWDHHEGAVVSHVDCSALPAEIAQRLSMHTDALVPVAL